MNSNARPKLVGRHVRLRPLSLRLDERGNRLVATDELWVVAAAGTDHIEIRQVQAPELTCRLTFEQMHGLFFDREKDGEPGTLRLNGRLVVCSDGVEFGPA
jgi:hypothetical protein